MFTYSEIEEMQKLTAGELAAFCDYWNSNIMKPAKPLPKADIPAEVDPETYRRMYRRTELAGGWFILDHRFGEECVLFDSANVLRAKGSSSSIACLLANEVRKKNISQKLKSKDYGLVLAGGGAKGAFELGVWKWLHSFGIAPRVTGMSGTSVGALNSVLFSRCSYEEAETIWKSITQNDMTYLDEKRVREIAEDVSQIIAALISHVYPATFIARSMIRMAGPVFTQEKLEEIARKVLEPGLSDTCAIYACASRSSLQIQRHARPKEVWQSFFNADYYCLNGLETEDQVNLVLASACLPFVYTAHEFGGMTYYDGGCRDNVPAHPLVRAGFRKLVVVHLQNKKPDEPEVERIGDTELFHVYPAQKTAGFMKTIRITRAQTEEWINDGFQSAAEQLGRYFKDGELVSPCNLEVRNHQVNKFNFEDFDYESKFAEVQAEVVKPNILVCGATGVGKSSLIKDFFDLDDAEAPEIGNDGKAKTVSVHKYSPKGSTVTLFDSAGYVFGAKAEAYKKDILGTIGDRVRNNPGDMNEHIHEVWYCVSVANKRFYDADKQLIDEIINKYHVPVMVILTKVDLADEQDIVDMKHVIRDFREELPVFTYSVAPAMKELDEATYRKYVQKDEITEWAIENLTDALRMGFIPALKGSLKAKRDYVISKEIPKYAGLAGAVVIATSFVNVPFTDSVPLMTLQVRMAYSIFNDYGIKMELQKTITDVVGTSFITYIGRTLASQLISVIPIAGNAIKATVNTSVAAGITAVLGASLALICEQYLAMCVDANGAKNLPFAKYLTAERMKEAVAYVNAHKTEFNIEGIVKSVTDKKNG